MVEEWHESVHPAEFPAIVGCNRPDDWIIIIEDPYKGSSRHIFQLVDRFYSPSHDFVIHGLQEQDEGFPHRATFIHSTQDGAV